MDIEIGSRAEISQPIGNREERKEKGLVGSYLISTRLYGPKAILESIEGRELSLSLVLYRLDRTS